MDAAEVRVGTRRGKRERITVVGVQRLGSGEPVVRRGDAMGGVVLVGPGDRGACLYRQGLRSEGEVVDRHGAGRSLCPTPPAKPEPAIAPKTAAAIADRIIIFLSLARSGIVHHERPFCWLEANTNAACKEKTEQRSCLFLAASVSYRLTPWVPNNQNAEVSHNTIRMANSTPPAMGSAQPG